MIRPETPIEVLDNALMRTIVVNKYRNPKSLPGQVILDMNPEQREILKNLTSSDVANVRPDSIFGDAWGKK